MPRARPTVVVVPPLTLMCVHAHPDDEAISTGGVLARYAAEGIETVLVTCTNGELGDGAGGARPGSPGHTEQEVVATRLAELEASCAALDVGHLELLGYHDSGMAGWPHNDAPEAFWHVDVDAAAERLAGLMARYRPQVVVTYDERGFYGHPDHVQAHRVTMRAIEWSGVCDKLYYPAVPRTAIPRVAELLAARGVHVPAEIADAPFATPDEEIGAVVDCSAVAAAKYASLSAHASQAEHIFFVSLGEEVFAEAFSKEAFVRAHDRTGRKGVEVDLFSGLR